VQWNPPGVPELCCWRLRSPYRDKVKKREGGYYTFVESEGTTSFLRVLPSGEEKVVFSEVEWIAFSDEVLMFRGDGFYGTVIKGNNLEATDADMKVKVESSTKMKAVEWLESNF